MHLLQCNIKAMRYQKYILYFVVEKSLIVV